uniref:Uncharacterized protein LOC104213708 n=1 Tax=Nicotiana sylvestris TaxID=4096 RepID=A0A1U7V584_NICSY|nr:PREDICTED: uncharacterized protein LOC104213708 [Nicotiana sylvestris]
MDVFGPIELTASNGHRFILVAIYYFTRWVEAASDKAVTKKVVADFLQYHIVCRFGVSESIITDNVVNVNCDLMKSMCKAFKIKHQNSTTYRTIVRTSTGETPYLLVYGTEAVILAEVEIPSLRIIQEVELSDVEWVQNQYEQLALIDGKRMNAVCHGQLYQNRTERAFNKKVRSRQFTSGNGAEMNLPTLG